MLWWFSTSNVRIAYSADYTVVYSLFRPAINNIFYDKNCTTVVKHLYTENRKSDYNFFFFSNIKLSLNFQIGSLNFEGFFYGWWEASHCPALVMVLNVVVSTAHSSPYKIIFNTLYRLHQCVLIGLFNFHMISRTLSWPSLAIVCSIMFVIKWYVPES